MDRPNPDLLLQQLSQQKQKAQRGKLRIYFGAVAGVGKTYAMLSAAKEAQHHGVKVLVGLIETHGRKETEKQLQGFDLLSRVTTQYKGKIFQEFDLNKAIEAKPDLLLVDELAHSNFEGSRHPKRWQDIDEILSQGINVWTTLNVQHLESLNSVISQITEVTIHETVPDIFFESADEVILVDTTTDEILHRLQVGKIYQKEQINHAFNNFFRRGNLISLREIALRRTADRIKSDVHHYRQEKSIQKVWQTEPGILVYIVGELGDENIIREAARWAQQLGCAWHTVFVENTDLQKKSTQYHNAILTQLKFAESLGAITQVIMENDTAKALVDYIRKNNLSKLLSCNLVKKEFWWQKNLMQRIALLAPELDFIQIAKQTQKIGKIAQTQQEKITHEQWLKTSKEKVKLGPYFYTTGLTCLLTVTIWPISEHLDPANIVLFFLLMVILASIRYGRNVGIFTSIISVLLFDFCFVAPRFSLNITDLQYLVTFAVMLFVGSLSSQLMASLKYRAKIAKTRETRVQSLFQFAKALSGYLETEQVIKKSIQVIMQEFGGKIVLLLPTSEEQLQDNSSEGIDIAIAQWAFDHQVEAGFATNTLPKHPFRYVPLNAPVRIRGILAIAPKHLNDLLIPEKKQLLETITSLIAIALERIHFAEVARQVLIQVESEQLRNTLLSTISHDLRTPLTSLMGQSENLMTHHQTISKELLKQNLQAIYDNSRSIHNIVCNVLDMARIDTGHFKAKLDWYAIEEIIGSVLHTISLSYPQIKIKVNCLSTIPLVEFDPLLIERVLYNLIENAIKYSQDAPDVQVDAEYQKDRLIVSVLDRGIGLPEGHEQAIFKKFNRGKIETAYTGVGLGLSIAKTIINAHKGTIIAKQRVNGGSCFTFTIPARPMPLIELESSEIIEQNNGK
ncbi:sensor histidine kinase KdpD [Commensalibacter nepenthis]|uniref:histidine kinase n=1 Tax=Commensalibacter nepenthis TaxID=3043872 RepID=A0ABT6Q4H6_9PROT|nr:sensor histidine kinase KdpD [Commensalibacter sp. TBRC 10068]MDI2111801.1 sensor histidine kinase KdpD [Commensalibacter sp. TBRC 10068]